MHNVNISLPVQHLVFSSIGLMHQFCRLYIILLSLLVFFFFKAVNLQELSGGTGKEEHAKNVTDVG